MERQKKRRFSAEFKAEAVKLVVGGGRSQLQIARELEISPSALSNWVRQAQIDAGQGPDGALTTEEKQELTRLRRENRQLREEKEILKKAAAFFAKENG